MNALLFNTPDNPRALAEYSSIHQADHFDITNQIFQKLGIATIQQEPLDPIPQFDLLTWLMNHQFLHNQINALLDTPGYDLTSVDFRDRTQFLIWTRYNALEHYAMTQALANIQTQAGR